MCQLKFLCRIVFFSLVISTLLCFTPLQYLAAKQASGGKPEGKTIYQAQIPEGMTYDTAIKNLSAILGGDSGPFGIRYYGKPELLYYAGNAELIQLLKGGTDFEYQYYDNIIQYILFNSITLTGNRLILSPQLSVRLSDLDYQPVEVIKFSHKYKYAVYSGPLSFHFKDKDIANKFADMLCAVQKFMSLAAIEKQNQLAEFETLAAKYRELTIKPEMAEEQRKYIVQANALTKQKDYESSIEVYLKAVEIDPVSYPEAYSNLALLSAQLNRPDEAISYMKQYLMLVPDAKDARSAQDRIYEWEIRIKK